MNPKSAEAETPFPLDAYLDRIGLPAAPPATIEGLAALQTAHRRAIPFENLDIPLGRGISLDELGVFDKLVRRRRGGYCFEQNGLFRRALVALGFDARPLLARVWLMAVDMPPLTHTLNLVTIDDRCFIADAGFGGSFVPPLPLEQGAEATTPDRARHRLVETPAGWMLERAGPVQTTDRRAADTPDWQPQYSFTLAPVETVDLEMSNHWTSTRPDTRFTTLVIASIVLPDGFVSLTGRDLTVARAGGTERHLLEDAESYRAALSKHFGLSITPEEVAALGLF